MDNIAGITTLTGQLMTNMVRGYSAYEIAVQNGFEGTVEEWLESLVGESVTVEVVENTEFSYVLSFTVGDETITTPNLRQNLNEMKTQISDMQTLVNRHGAQLVTLDDRVAALEQGGGGEESGLADRVTALEQDAAETNERVSVVESSVESVQAQMAEANTQIEGLNTTISAIGSDITNLNGEVQTLISDVEDLKRGDSGVAQRIANVEARMATVESSIGNLNTAMTSFESRISSVEEQIEELEEDLTKHNTSVDSHVDIREQLTELKTKFDTYIDSTDVDLDQLSEIVTYIKNISAVEIVDELPTGDDIDPRKIYILRSTLINQGEEVGG